MKWISVKDRLPDSQIDVLCVDYMEEYGLENHCFVGFYEGDRWHHAENLLCTFNDDVIEPTHWMPLPEMTQDE